MAQGKVVVIDKSNSGLPSNYVASLLMDSKNNLWVGTNDAGIAMFNGSSWTYYDSTNTPQLGSNYINHIKEHPNGDMWFSTKAGISVLSNGSWTYYDKTTIAGGFTWRKTFIQFDSNGDAYTLCIHKSSVKGLFKFSSGAWSMANKDTTDFFDGYPSPRYFIIDQNDHIWLKCGVSFDGTNWNRIPYNDPNLRISYDKSGVAIDDNQDMWFYLVDLSKSVTHILYKYSNGKLTPTTSSGGEGAAILQKNPYNGLIYHAGSMGPSLGWYDGGWKGDPALNLKMSQSNLRGIKAMTFDSKGNTWLGLNNYGEFWKDTPTEGGIAIYNPNGVDLTNFPVGINHVSNNSHSSRIFSVPANEHLNLELPAGQTGKFQVFNMNGTEVFSGAVGNKVRIETAEWSEGIYYYLINSDGSSDLKSGKIIVRH